MVAAAGKIKVAKEWGEKDYEMAHKLNVYEKCLKFTMWLLQRSLDNTEIH